MPYMHVNKNWTQPTSIQTSFWRLTVNTNFKKHRMMKMSQFVKNDWFK